MAKIKYQVLESNIGGTHSHYAKAIATGALTFDEMCEKAPSAGAAVIFRERS